MVLTDKLMLQLVTPGPQKLSNAVQLQVSVVLFQYEEPNLSSSSGRTWFRIHVFYTKNRIDALSVCLEGRSSENDLQCQLNSGVNKLLIT